MHMDHTHTHTHLFAFSILLSSKDQIVKYMYRRCLLPVQRLVSHLCTCNTHQDSNSSELEHTKATRDNNSITLLDPYAQEQD